MMKDKHLQIKLKIFIIDSFFKLMFKVNKINSNYPGGIETYFSRAKKLLHDSSSNVNPYEDFKISVPKGIKFT